MEMPPASGDGCGGFPSFHDHDRSSSPSSSSSSVPPGGPVLYVTPLRIMAPSGGRPFPAPRDIFGGGFNPEWLKQQQQQQQQMRFENGSHAFPPCAGFPTPPPPAGFPPAASAFPPGPWPVWPPAAAMAADSLKNPKSGGPSSEKAAGRSAAMANSPYASMFPPSSSSSSVADGAVIYGKRPKPASSSASPPDAAKKVCRQGNRPFFPVCDPRASSKATLRLYDALRRRRLQAEETNGKEPKRGVRADLIAGSLANTPGLNACRGEKAEGPFPGVDIGDLFCFRMEISCIGLHGPVQGGIDYFTAKDSRWTDPVAISVISSGGYDAQDDGETLIYTGQGGKGSGTSYESRLQSEDQKLERGNLAMEGSKKHGIPVRVIRGIKEQASPSGKVYTYDGLYRVQSSWSEKGKSGFEEFKFKLQRIPGQPELGSSVVRLSKQLKLKPSLREGVTAEDISGGREALPVCVVNTIDSEPFPTPPFHYSSAPRPAVEGATGCDCKGSCGASNECLCFAKNGSELAYLSSGALVRARDCVFECGSRCACPPTCRNRLTQRGSRFRFEVFRTAAKGWGLRSWDPIPTGSFVCEYVGNPTDRLDDNNTDNNTPYLLDIEKASTKETRSWGDVFNILQNTASNPPPDYIVKQNFCLDASRFGNMARFINHSCMPNLMIQCVQRDLDNLVYPHVMLFAMDTIPPFKELSLDYGYDEGLNEASQGDIST